MKTITYVGKNWAYRLSFPDGGGKIRVRQGKSVNVTDEAWKVIQKIAPGEFKVKEDKPAPALKSSTSDKSMSGKTSTKSKEGGSK